MCTKRRTPPLLGGRQEVARALDHDPLELLRLPWRIATRWTTVSTPSTARAGWPHRSCLPGRARSPTRELLGALGVRTRQRTGRSVGAQRVHDCRSDEAGPPRDQDHEADSTTRPWIVCISLRSADRLDLALAGILPGPYEGRALFRGSPGFEGATRAPPQDGSTATVGRTRDPDLGGRGDLLHSRDVGRRNRGTSRHDNRR